MKDFTGFIEEAVAGEQASKLLQKKFRNMKKITKPMKKFQMQRGHKIETYTIPKVKPQEVRDFLISLGYKVEEEFEVFIDMYCVYHKVGATYKANIVSTDTSKDIELRLSSHMKGKSSKSFRKDTFSNQNAINQNKFSGKSPRYR